MAFVLCAGQWAQIRPPVPRPALDFMGRRLLKKSKPALVKTLRHALTLTDCVLVHNGSPYT